MQKWERCLWLIDLFSSYGELSLREVNERFMRYSRNEMGESLSERMFLRDREYIASTFQLDIEYDGHIRKYRLNNREVIRQNPLYRYLLVKRLATLAPSAEPAGTDKDTVSVADGQKQGIGTR